MRISFLSLAWLAAAGPLNAQTLEHEARFAQPEFSKSRAGEYDLASIPGLPLDNRPGAPMLPVRYVSLLIPPGARAVSVDIVRSDEKRMVGEFLPPPGRREAPLSEKPTAPDPGPDLSIYGSKEPYPASQAELVHQGSMGGLGVATVKVYPLRYLGADRSLLSSTDVLISLRLAYGGSTGINVASGAVRELAWRLADNRRDLDAWYPDVQKMRGKDGAYDLLVVTGAPFDTVLQRLAGWKQSRGLVTEIALTDSIYSSVIGFDRQEKIRNFISERVQNSGVSYVILGGDTAVVPARVAFAMASGYDSLAPGRDSLRADLYYGCLDGSWNGDGDGTWGELEDSVDMYPDVVVGRAPINNLADAQTFVRKVMEYEQGVATDFLNRASLWAEMLDYVTDGAAGAGIIDRDHLTPFFKPAEKLYESLGNQTRASTIEAYRQGRHLVNHIGHAWYTSLNVGPGFTGEHEIRAGDFDTIPTGGRWGIVYSIGCMPAAMERSCLAEHYLNSPAGGGAAFIGNCSYGWSLPYFSGYASSDLYNQQFFHEALEGGCPTLGLAHVTAKAGFVGAAQEENEYRWVMYGLNLFGDPTLALWTEWPESLYVACADSLGSGAGGLAAYVSSGGRPLPGATLTLRGDSAYSRTATDGAGQALIPLNAMAGDTLVLTAAARNCLPVQKAIPVFEIGTQVAVRGRQVSELEGNGDGLPGPGELLALSFLVANAGSAALGDSLGIVLRPADTLSTVLDSSFTVPAPAPGESLWTGPQVSFLADSSLADGDFALMSLSAHDSSGRSWGFPVGVRLAAPSLSFAGYEVDDRAGNGNGVPEPGETAILYVNIVNNGQAAMAEAEVSLATADPFVAVDDSTDSLDAVPPDSAGKASFSIYLDPGATGPWRSPLFNLECRHAWKAWRDSFPAAMGQVGFADDMESGSPGWYATLPDSNEGGWHLSQVRSHSPGHSWYFGSESDTLMPSCSLDTLETPAFAVGQRCSLGYWQWHEFLPGWGRGVVEVCGGFGARLLEVVEGSSGGWKRSDHDLSAYRPGTELSLRFIAFCDSASSEGWYIDDVSVRVPPTGVTSRPPQPDRRGLALLPSRPNPAADRADLEFHLPREGRATLRVYNVQGQLVRTLARGAMGSGWHRLVWDCRDDRGRAVAGGMYLYRLSTDGRAATGKMMVIR